MDYKYQDVPSYMFREIIEEAELLRKNHECKKSDDVTCLIDHIISCLILIKEWEK